MIREILSNRAFEVRNARECPASNAAARNFGKETLDLIEPASARGSEVQSEAWMPRKPTLDHRLLMSRVIVQYKMNVQVCRNISINFAKESGADDRRR